MNRGGAVPEDNGLQIIERVELSDDEDDDFAYERVDDDLELDEDDEDLAEALASIQLKTKNGQSQSSQLHSTNTVTQIRPAVVDDFIRNFMIKAGMKRSLEAFNTEWYELQSKGNFSFSSNIFLNMFIRLMIFSLLFSQRETFT